MDAKTDVTISNKNPSIAGTNIVTDSQTVFVDVENNKTWTGYKNVTNKSKANVIAQSRTATTWPRSSSCMVPT